MRKNKGDKTVAIIQARMTSSRLPGKVLLPLAGKTVLEQVIDRIKNIDKVDEICVAIPDGEAHLPLEEFLKNYSDVSYIKGAEDNVLQRFIIAIKKTNADHVVRITSDCPFLDPEVSNTVIEAYHSSSVPYARTAIEKGYPLGFDTEVISSDALLETFEESKDPYEWEHVTPFIWRHPERYPCVYISAVPDRRDWRLVLDTEQDYQLAESIYDCLYDKDKMFLYSDIVDLIKKKPELLAINSNLPKPEYKGLVDKQ